MLLQPAGAEGPQAGCDWVVLQRNRPPCLESDHPLSDLVKDVRENRDLVPSGVLAPTKVRSLKPLTPIQLTSKIHNLAFGISQISDTCLDFNCMLFRLRSPR